MKSMKFYFSRNADVSDLQDMAEDGYAMARERRRHHYTFQVGEGKLAMLLARDEVDEYDKWRSAAPGEVQAALAQKDRYLTLVGAGEGEKRPAEGLIVEKGRVRSIDYYPQQRIATVFYKVGGLFVANLDTVEVNGVDQEHLTARVAAAGLNKKLHIA